jgi:hypothetical protein
MVRLQRSHEIAARSARVKRVRAATLVDVEEGRRRRMKRISRRRAVDGSIGGFHGVQDRRARAYAACGKSSAVPTAVGLMRR